MHWYTCKSLLNTFRSAVEQLAECFAKQVSQQSRSKYNSNVKPARSVLQIFNMSNWCARVSFYTSSDIGHAHSSTHRMRLSPGTLRDPCGNIACTSCCDRNTAPVASLLRGCLSSRASSPRNSAYISTR